MAQKNSFFVWKTSNYSRGRSNLRNNMNQVTNLELLGLTRERIANLLGVFPEVVLCDIDFRGFFDVAFDPICGRPCCKTSIICISCRSRWFTSTNPKKLTALTSPPSTSYTGEYSLPNSCVTHGCWFSSINHFAMFTKSINDCTFSFGAFSPFIVLE